MEDKDIQISLIYSQERIFIDEKKNEALGSNTISLIVKMEEKIDCELLRKAINIILDDNASLRLRLIEIHEEVKQYVSDYVFKYVDVFDFNLGYESEEFSKHISSMVNSPLEMFNADLFYFAVIRLINGKGGFFLKIHRIIADLWSADLIVNRVLDCYYALKRGLSVETKKSYSYIDFIERAQNNLVNANSECIGECWSDKFSNLSFLGSTKDNTPLGIYPNTNTKVYTISGSLLQHMESYLTKYGTSVFPVLNSVLYLLFSKLYSSEDIVFGAAIHNRFKDELLDATGALSSIVPISLNINSDISFVQLVDIIEKKQKSILNDESFLYEMIFQELKSKHNCENLFDFMLIYNNSCYSYNAEVNLLSLGYDQCPLAIYIEEPIGRSSLNVYISYKLSKFSDKDIDVMIERFLVLLEDSLENSESKVCNLNIMLPYEKKTVLYKFNNTDVEFPCNKTIHGLFEEQVNKTPNNIALMYRGKKLTYKELDESANRIAQYLNIEYKVKAENLVGVIMDRSDNLIEAIYGILKAGGAYVPIDPSYPEERMKMIINDTGLEVIISSSKHLELLNYLQWECSTFKAYICLDNNEVYINEASSEGIDDMKKLWDYVGSSGSDEITSGGWVKSYTGEEFTNAEMDEYADNVFEKLKPYLGPKVRVLEIGCASGISMFKIAPYVGLYYGTDISDIMVERNKQRVKEIGLENIELECMGAHEIDRLKNKEFDIVIINSVIQYFPGLNYLRDVFAKALQLINGKGILLIGDIRDQELKYEYLNSLANFKSINAKSNFGTKTGLKGELFVARGFFEDLMFEFQEIKSVDFSNKIHTIKNELTLYRYDALIQIDKAIKERLIKRKRNKIQAGREVLSKYPDKKVETTVRSTNLAYVIYTSGSTGKPKGVMIEHKSAINTLMALQSMYPLNAEDTYLLKTSYTFDVSVAELFGWFFAGGKLSILEPGGEKYPETIIQAIKKDCVTHINFAPSMLNTFLDMLNKESVEILEGLKYVFVAGEAISVETVRKFKDMIKGVRLENIYGPTETSIYATKYSIDSIDNKIRVPIGVPIQNTRAYIVDIRLNLQPIGVLGELCVCGEGLSRGYLNRPELTDEKFIDNPFELGKKLYKTGDLARWMPDGNIEFIGRIDNQVKVRGFRIELGEIEARLLKHELIKEAVVVAKEDTDESKYLCAYMVSDAKIDVSELRLHLAKELPEYMIPQYFVRIEKMPLNQSGKIDRKSLPEPYGYIDTGVEYEAPRNEVEVKLSEIWQEVLGVNKVGINDNFFELGGDSIKAIQVSARMQRYQLKLETKDLQANPTISKLSGYVKKTTREIYQGIVEGGIELTPIQRWYFEKEFTNEHHFNQAFMLHRKEGFKENAVREAFDKILEHHDALRMTFRRENGGVIQINRGIEGKLYDIETVDLTGIEEYESKMEEVCNKIQGSIDLCNGPLVKLCLFRTSKGDHMLIVIHHLVVDGVSWRIIFEDFAFCYIQALENKEIVLPQKTDSYKEWAGKIKEYVQGRKIEEEREYWEKVCSYKTVPLPKDNEAKSNRMKDNVSHIVSLTEEDTSKLLKQVNKAYNTEINDILLAALGLTIKEWTSEENVFLCVEGHGREDIIEEININRTVGWFTSAYPIILHMGTSNSSSCQIKEVKESLRNIPNKGIGYGILRYISEDNVSLRIKPEICFNYLGQFDQDIDRTVFSATGVLGLPRGIYPSAETERIYTLDITGIVIDGKMAFVFDYNMHEYKQETINELTQNYLKNILKLIEHCEKKENEELTPSDVGYSGMSLEDFGNIKDFISNINI